MSTRVGARKAARLAGAVLLLAGALGLSGCNFFFQCQKASCPTTTSSTSTTGDYAYVSNSTSGSTYVAEYNIGSGALTAISGSPFSLGYVPVAMKVSPNNAFLYVGSGAGGIYLYTINSSTGALTSASSNPQITTGSASLSSLDISPDGNYLFALDSTGFILSEYALNTSSGALTGPTTFATPGTSGCTLAGTPVSQSCTVKVSPSGSYVAVALGTAGTVVYPYTSSGGITNTAYIDAIPCCGNVSSPSGDFSLAFDSNDYLYIARTSTLSSYGSVGSSTATYEGSVTYTSTSGTTPRAVTLSNAYTYLYTANEGSSNISGFGLSGAGSASALSGSPYTGPTNVSALAWDNTSTYLIAVGYNASSGVQLFKPSSGVLGSAVASAGTGTSPNYPALVALTH